MATVHPIGSSWDRYVHQFREADRTQQDSLWTKGDIALEVDTKYGEGSLERFAEDVGVGKRYVELLRRVSRVFEKRTRVRNLSWKHHRISARTDDPHGWIQKAKNNEWSTRELEAAIKEATEEPLTPWEDMVSQGDRMDRAFRKFFEDWTTPSIDGRHKQFVVGQARVLHRICERVIQSDGRYWERLG